MKSTYIFRITVFMGIIIIIVLNMNFKKNQVSTIDNRNLTELSEVFNSNIVNNVQNYVNDRIGFREDFINIYTNGMDKAFNYMVHPSYQYGEEGYVFPKLKREEFDKEFQDIFSDFIKTLQDYCKEKDIDFLYTVEPSKISVYDEYLPKGANYKNYNLNYFLEKLKEKDINYLYSGDELLKYKKDYAVFDKKYDANHWNEIGAIIAINNIINKIIELNPDTKKFDINKYNKEIKINETLPVSYFPINEETNIFKLKESILQEDTTHYGKIKISEQYKNFVHYKNKENLDAPKILIFAGSYFNDKEKFIAPSFSETIKVHNYHNVIDYKYYIELFKPDIVLFESTEYTHKDSYFPRDKMKEVILN